MDMRERMNPAVFDLKRSAIREFSRLAAETPGCVRLTLGEPDQDTPEVICREVSAALAAGETHYIENNGSRELREKIADYECRVADLDYSADEVIVTAGATEALAAALIGILEPGDEVIVPEPAFVLYEQLINLCRAKCVTFDTSADGFQLRRDALHRAVTDRTKAIILNSPNNPTGCIYDAESLETVREIVKNRGIFVICDDVYRSLIYTEEYHSFAEYSDLKDRIIVVQSFSKPYAMTGWRVGYLMADAPVKERLELVHQFMVVSVPAPFQRACMKALDTDVSGMLEEYRFRRDYVLTRLRQMGMEMNEPKGAFYAFPSIRQYGLDSAEFCRRLIQEAGVAVTPGIAFGSDEYIRISYCCSREALREGLDRLERFVLVLGS